MNTKQNKETNNKSNSNDLEEGQDIPLDKVTFDKLTVNDLKKELKCRIQSSIGKKVELQD